jgi:hypothetical protein
MMIVPHLYNFGVFHSAKFACAGYKDLLNKSLSVSININYY